MIHVVLRTCNRTSLQSDRIVNKSECILRCLNSIINNLKFFEISNLFLALLPDIIKMNRKDDLNNKFLLIHDFLKTIGHNQVMTEKQESLRRKNREESYHIKQEKIRIVKSILNLS